MSEHDQLARQMLGNNGLSKGQSRIELSPLEQLIARVTVRWPFPEMGQLEYADWMESLKSCPLEKIQAALDRLMLEPPKRELSDGTISEYRGRPTLIDVLRTMDILQDESAAKWREAEAERSREEWRQMEKRRAEHPEEFFGLADVLKAASVSDAKQATKAMPNVRTVFPDIDPEKNAEKLRHQAEKLKAGIP